MAGNGEAREPKGSEKPAKPDILVTTTSFRVALSKQEIDLVLMLIDRTQMSGIDTFRTVIALVEKLKQVQAL